MISKRVLQQSYELIRKNTRIKSKDLVPEFKLHLLDDSCPWYYQKEVSELESDPFWSIFWPGGQALSRYVLDNPAVVKEKHVLDIGCGCGALGLAASIAGSKSIICNDIDLTALAAVQLNFKLNQLNPPELSAEDLIGASPKNQPRSTSIFLGDMFYDEDIAEKIVTWCLSNSQSKNEIFIGDPGRWGLEFIKDYITKVAEYDIIDDDCDEFRSACVFKFVHQLND